MAAEIDRKARAERLKKLFDEENEKYEEELKGTIHSSLSRIVGFFRNVGKNWLD